MLALQSKQRASTPSTNRLINQICCPLTGAVGLGEYDNFVVGNGLLHKLLGGHTDVVVTCSVGRGKSTSLHTSKVH